MKDSIPLDDGEEECRLALAPRSTAGGSARTVPQGQAHPPSASYPALPDMYDPSTLVDQASYDQGAGDGGFDGKKEERRNS